MFGGQSHSSLIMIWAVFVEATRNEKSLNRELGLDKKNSRVQKKSKKKVLGYAGSNL
jgi:hypothetical protein